MKKIIVLILVGIIALASCKKNESNSKESTLTKNQYKSALEYSKTVNEKYRKNNQQLNLKEPTKGQRAAVTVMADVAASGTAAATMGSLWLAAPWGTIASAIVTGCAGASGSILAYYAMSPTKKKSTNGISDPIFEHANSILLDTELELDSNPFGNPYDSIGYKHNTMVKRYFTTSDNFIIPNSSSFLFNYQNLTNEENTALQSTNLND